MAKTAKKARKGGDQPTIAVNKRARREYEIVETYEAGIELTGTEVKSLRAGRVSIKEAFGLVKDGQVWLVQAHIAHYDYGNRFNHDPTRWRRLLLHRHEIDRVAEFTREQGRTLAVLQLYWLDGKAKALVGLAKGKATRDKRRDEAERDAQREMQRALKYQGRR
jgi:SsrA-binding protein